MKSKLASMATLTILLSGAFFSVASAEGLGVSASATVTIDNKDTDTEVRAKIQGNATSTATRDADEKAEHATSTQDQSTGESHRSEVSVFVHSLLNIADREHGIGSEVREVAMSQQHSASTSAEAMMRVQARGALRTFILGSDYRSLGEIRSEIATTTANIAKLQRLLASATSDADKAELSAQIKVLENAQVSVSAFVKAHESSFSLLGWFTKLFAK
jgi:hypothetical protein